MNRTETENIPIIEPGENSFTMPQQILDADQVTAVMNQAGKGFVLSMEFETTTKLIEKDPPEYKVTIRFDSASLGMTVLHKNQYGVRQAFKRLRFAVANLRRVVFSEFKKQFQKRERGNTEGV